MFKILNIVTGQFCSGGYYASFTKNGKVWRTLGHLRSAISGSVGRADARFKDCVIVEYEMTEVSRLPVMELLEVDRIKKAEAALKAAEDRKAALRAKEIELMNDLIKKYGVNDGTE